MTMRRLALRVPAKLNLYLDVLYRRDDGYHEIESLAQSISLYDVLRLEKIKKGIEIDLSEGSGLRKEDNLVFKAAKLFFEVTSISPGVKIYLEKKIPVGGGLGGGSADAAGTLIGLNWLFDTRIDLSRLLSCSLKLGADVPFCILGGTAILRGKGEKIYPLPSMREGWVVLVYPEIPVSTAWAYSKVSSRLTLSGLNVKLNLSRVKQILSSRKLTSVEGLLYNKLEEVVVERFPVIGDIKKKIKNMGVRGVLMSGSGSTVFGLVEDRETALKLAKALSGKGKVFVTQPVEGVSKED